MNNNYPTQPLNTRPKRTDNTAVEAWLKENKPTVLPSFEKVAHKPKHKAYVDSTMLAKAQGVINSINSRGMTESQFNGRCRYDKKIAQEIKRAIKIHFGLTLKTVQYKTNTGKLITKMELVK